MADLNDNIDPKLDDTTEDTLELDDLDTVAGGKAVYHPEFKSEAIREK